MTHRVPARAGNFFALDEFDGDFRLRMERQQASETGASHVRSQETGRMVQDPTKTVQQERVVFHDAGTHARTHARTHAHTGSLLSLM